MSSIGFFHRAWSPAESKDGTFNGEPRLCELRSGINVAVPLNFAGCVAPWLAISFSPHTPTCAKESALEDSGGYAARSLRRQGHARSRRWLQARTLVCGAPLPLSCADRLPDGPLVLADGWRVLRAPQRPTPMSHGGTP
jgi:hypothetical protein